MQNYSAAYKFENTTGFASIQWINRPTDSPNSIVGIEVLVVLNGTHLVHTDPFWQLIARPRAMWTMFVDKSRPTTSTS